MLVIVDYGAGNLLSIKNMMKKVGVEVHISSSVKDIANAAKLILPGVGAFDYGMQQLHDSGLIEVLNEKVLVQKTPVLGICLGMQLLTKSSGEGKMPGLGWIDANTVRFRMEDHPGLKIPNMGWLDVQTKRPSRLLENLQESRFYFVHSYHVECKDQGDVILASEYGYEFVCGVEHGNIVGVQFHPEKSHKYGMQLLKNFIDKY